MLQNLRLLLGVAAVTAGLGGMVQAQENAHDQREAFMKSMGARVGVLAGMAQGKEAYDAEKAKTAATELAALAAQDWAPLFPAGSDADALGAGKAKPEIWANFDDFLARKQKLADATQALAGTAGTGLDALKAGIGPVGGSCGSCHETYRR